MFALLKLLQSLIKTLHSEGTPGQIAAGMALGSALGLTPLMNVHNLVIVFFLFVLNVSFGAGLFAWALFVPLGFLLDPLFDRIGRALLLETPSLRPLWTSSSSRSSRSRPAIRSARLLSTPPSSLPSARRRRSPPAPIPWRPPSGAASSRSPFSRRST